MRLHAFTLDEDEAMRLRKQGWKFKSMEGSQWELVWPTTNSEWPAEPKKPGASYRGYHNE